jgi:hypothetical protein
MPSFVWDREPSEAYSEPYEYGAQEQFAREAATVIDRLCRAYEAKNRTFTREDQSKDRAIWMLQVDALSALAEALPFINEKRFRIVSRLFRDIAETLDLSFYFARGGQEAGRNLEKWFDDEVIPHRVYREFVRRAYGAEHAENLKSYYSDLSRYTHRTYRALLMSYSVANCDRLIYDGFRGGKTDLVLPHVVSFSYALLARLIHRFILVAEITEQVSKAQISEIWAQSLEAESVPRRFGTGPGQLRREPPMRLSIPDENDG